MRPAGHPFLEGEARAEFVISPMRRHEARRIAHEARGGDLDELPRHFADALLEPGFPRLPRSAAKPIKVRLGVF